MVQKDIERNKEIRDERIFQIVSDIVPQSWGIKIVNEYPHLDSSYTQGLAFHNNKLFESTGDPNTTGSSLVGEIALETGKINRRTGLDNTFFGDATHRVGNEFTNHGIVVGRNGGNLLNFGEIIPHFHAQGP